MNIFTAITMPKDNIKTIASPSSNFSWINIVDAGKKEIDYLRRKFKFNHLDLEDSYVEQYAQRPKFIVRQNYCFLILQFPVYNRKARAIYAEEIDFFITKDALITLHGNHLPPMVKLFNSCLTNEFYRGQHLDDDIGYLLYEIIACLQEYCYPILDHVSLDIKNIEINILSDQSKRMIKEILFIKKNMGDIKKILEAHKNCLQKISHSSSPYLNIKQNKSYYSDLIENIKDIWDLVQGNRDIIESLEDTNSTLVYLNLNGIMKTLTVFSVIILPLTFLSGLFGMNTVDGMPLVNNPNGFFFIVGTMTVIGLSMFLYFKRKRWI